MKSSTAVVLVFACIPILFLPQRMAAQQPQHQHVAAAHTDHVIDGTQHPELVPDSAAYRLYFVTVSLSANPTDKDKKVQDAHLAKINLDPIDKQAFVTVVANFRSQYDAWTARWNAAATAQGDSFDPAPFLQQRDDLVQATRAAIGQSLSISGVKLLDAHIQGEKKRMKVAVP